MASGAKLHAGAAREPPERCRGPYRVADPWSTRQSLAGVGAHAVQYPPLRFGALQEEHSPHCVAPPPGVEPPLMPGCPARDEFWQPMMGARPTRQHSEPAPSATREAPVIRRAATARRRAEDGSLRRQLCRGLDRIEQVATEARRRNLEVTRCLNQVQADIAQVTQKMMSARQRGRGDGAEQEAAGPSMSAKPVNVSTSSPLRCRAGPVGRSRCRVDADGDGARPRTADAQPPERWPSTAPLNAAVCAGIRSQLLAARGSSDAEKRSLVKGMLVRWHPDRNPEQVALATEVFQYIQQEKRLLEHC